MIKRRLVHKLLWLAVLPYLVLRGPVTRIARRWVGNEPVSDPQ